MKSSHPVKSALAALILSASFWLISPAWAGDFVVIVNKDNAAQVDKAFIAKVFTGDLKSWKDGSQITPIDLPEDNPVRASFSTDVLGKSVGNVKAQWAQLIFSGRALPPKQVGSDEEVKKLVSANKAAIGYIKASSLDDSVKAVLK
jgi:ABC-type phosphate transport system substrate-binding protein